MRDKNLTNPWSAGPSVLLALVLVFSQAAWAVDASKSGAQAGAGGAAPAAKAQANATPSTAAQTSPSQNAEQKETASKGGRDEGIKVHGHWTIEVRNPDGEVVTHREFENGLVLGAQGGNVFLAQILGRQNTVGAWEVLLYGSFGYIYIDELSSPLAISCVGGPVESCSTNLAVSAASGTVTLAGSAVVPSAYGIEVVSVYTSVYICNATSTPQACPTSSPPPGVVPADGFTSRNLDGVNGDPAPVPVSPGQTVAVTVTFSFS